MSNHPVQLRVERTTHFARVHIVIRLALLLAVGVIGCASLYWMLYLALPALVAMVVMQKGGDHYIAEDAPRVVRVLRWLAGAYAYLWLLTDVLPTTSGAGAVEVEIEASGKPTAASSLSRLLSTLPALLLALVLSMAASLLWVIGAIAVLVNERMPAAIADFLEMALRFQTRLTAYHLSLVEQYPSLRAPTAAAAHASIHS